MKRVLSTIIMLALVLCMMPTSAFAATDATVYTEASKSTVKPNETLTYSVYLSGTYDGYSLKLNDKQSGLTVTNVTAEAGVYADDLGDAWMLSVMGGLCKQNSAKTKIATVTVTVDEDATPGTKDFGFSNISISNEIGNRATYSMELASVTVIAELTGTLGLTGVTAPVKNAVPANKTDITAPANTMVTSLVWSPAVSGKFALETDYTATINIEASDGYVFADGVTFTVDGESWTSAKQQDGSYNLSKTFPTTAGKDVLTGTPTISGTVKVGETLSAGVTTLSDSTNISYRWFANGTAISGATSNTYKLTVNEAGKTITVKVTATGASQYTGTVTSAATAAVANAAQVAPTISAGDIVEVTDSTITVTANANWEYSKDGGSSWQSSNIFTSLTPDTTYDQICVRLKAKTGYDASPASNTVAGKTAKAQIGNEAKGTLAGYSGTYDGVAHDAVKGAPAAGYTATYSTDNVSFSAAMPKVTNVADSKTVWVKLSKAGYEDKVFAFTATVSAKNISSATINLGTQKTYNGSAQNVVITSVTIDGNTLTKDTDYTITSGGSATNVAATTLTITGKGNYTGTKNIQWTLVAKSVSESMIASVASQPYTGSPIAPKPAVTDGSAMVENTDFTYSYEANTYVGTAMVKVTGKGNYTGAANKTFQITAVNQAPVITPTAIVTKGGNTVDLKPLVTNEKGTVTFAISGNASGCSISSGVLTSGSASGSVKVTVNITAKNVDGAGADEYNAYTGTDAITVTIDDKQSAPLTVSQTGCTFGETLAEPTYSKPAGTISTVVTYSGTLAKGGGYNSTTKPTEAGTYTVNVKCETATHVYEGTSASFTIVPKSISGMTVTLSASAKEYNGSEQSVTVASVETLAASDYTVSGAGSGTTVGNYTVTVTGKGNYTGTANATWKITPKAIAISGAAATNRGYAKDDKSVVISGVTFAGASLAKDADYTVTGIMDDANAGTGKTVNVTVVLTNPNYSLAATTTTTTVDIAKASSQTLPDIADSFKYTVTSGEKAVGTAGMPADAGTLTYTKGTESKTGSVTVDSWAVDASGKVTYTLSGGAENDTVTLPVAIQSTNYADSVVNVKLTLTAKEGQAALNITNGITVVYGKTLNLTTTGGSGTGAVTYAVTNRTGEATISGNVLTATKAGEVTVTATKADDDNYNAASSAPVTITISKATPTGTPGYTRITTSGKTLADAALTAGTITPAGGTIAWDLGDAQTVSANTSYNWTYTPADTINYNVLTGSIKPYVRSTGGGSSKVTYMITIEKAENGEVTASSKSASAGATITLTIKANEGYELDILKVLNKNDYKLEISSKDGQYTFKMPSSNVTVTATFKKAADTICDKYTDLAADAWYYDGVHYCIEKGVMVGTSETTFAPDENLSRAMMVQMLYNYVGQPATVAENKFSDVKADMWYYNAIRWGADKDVVSGYGDGRFGPDDNVTLEQAVAILHNYAGQPTGTGNAASLGVHSTWAANALNWAEANGVLKGMPHDALTATATRAQMAQMLMNYLKNEP